MSKKIEKNFLIDTLLDSNEYSYILENIKLKKLPINIIGPDESQKSHMIFSILEYTGKKGIIITYNEYQAKKIYQDLSLFLEQNVIFFPSRDYILYNVDAKSYEVVYQRINVLDEILNKNFKILVTSAEAISQKIIPKDFFLKNQVIIKLGSIINLDNLIKTLLQLGYQRESEVDGKGQFVIKGGIIDIFPINYNFAVRIELFDDTVDSIRKFDITTQRSIESIEIIKILPARDTIYDFENIDNISKLIENDLSYYIDNTKDKSSDELIREIKSNIINDIDNIKTKNYFPGMDRLIPYIMQDPVNILHYLDEDTIIVLDEPLKIEQRIDNIIFEHTQHFESLLQRGKVLPKSFELFFDYNGFMKSVNTNLSIILNTFHTDINQFKNIRKFNVPSKTMGSFLGNFQNFIQDIKSLKSQEYKIIIFSGTKTKGEKFLETLKDEGINGAYKDDLDCVIHPGDVFITEGLLNSGFLYSDINFALFSDNELFKLNKKSKKNVVKKKGKIIDTFTDLNPMDFVVHTIHGIGQYIGINQLLVDGVKKDYLKIRYNGDGFLYIPTNQLDLVQKYIGSDGKVPKLNKLGGSEWSKSKLKVKESLMSLAKELIELQAKREAVKGHKFSPDTLWQKQFEDLFIHQETDEQLKCIEDIKKDMESEKPMDRLLCGDVGYGKTEVAIRAIFKAVMDGKQVAYLVPTTILASQHYNNFKERMQDFPIKIDLLSRFRTVKQQKNTINNLKQGSIDVLVGTHRLLQKDVTFKELGLIVIDEEQRFGVMHKERLKNIKTNIDVLTLTATPIPRTLHMSLVGIKDICTIEEPPLERHPVQTYVMEYDIDIIKDAILTEMARNGQVFYLYNSVKNINEKAQELKRIVKDARIIVAHGQMNERELEDVMIDFLNGDYDVLVCTTIIESGLDMPNVNTIIIENADKMGLSQLYQLRGRVGRSNKLAYAYITYRKDKILSEVAEKRLKAIRDFTEFGSGFKVAMRDLEIRGAGNLIGKQQHGHMEAVGYDMYCKLLEKAIKELKGIETKEDIEISIDLNVDAYIESEYINEEINKLDMYKKIASIDDEEDKINIQEELTDRFGDITKPVENLIEIAYIKSLAKKIGFSSIKQNGENIIFQYDDIKSINFESIKFLTQKYKGQIFFSCKTKAYITYKIKNFTKEKLLENIKSLLHSIYKLQ